MLLWAIEVGAADPVVASVGAYTITKKDLDYKVALNKVDLPEAKPEHALPLLIKAFTAAQVLQNQGWPITPEVLEKEAKRIDDRTLDPNRLSQIKALFGKDRKSYLKVFILPTYAERVIYYEFFAFNPGIHQASKSAAREFIVEVKKKPAEFAELAKKKGRKVVGFTVTRAEGLKPDLPGLPTAGQGAVPPPSSNVPVDLKAKMDKNASKQESADGKRWIEEVVSVLKPGEVFGKVMEFQESWMVSRYLKATGEDSHRFEGVLFPKLIFDEWYKREKEKVKVKTTGA